MNISTQLINKERDFMAMIGGEVFIYDINIHFFEYIYQKINRITQQNNISTTDCDKLTQLMINATKYFVNKLLDMFIQTTKHYQSHTIPIHILNNYSDSSESCEDNEDIEDSEDSEDNIVFREFYVNFDNIEPSDIVKNDPIKPIKRYGMDMWQVFCDILKNENKGYFSDSNVFKKKLYLLLGKKYI
jgi:hypothetical protein